MQKVRIFRRADLTPIHDVTVDGKPVHIGEVRNFSDIPELAAFFPKSSQPAISWVKLKVGETNHQHVHPTDSLLIVAEGRGKLIGETEGEVAAGDIVAIPRGHEHGFIGAGDSGFWGISMQFEGASIYEDPAHPQATFK